MVIGFISVVFVYACFLAPVVIWLIWVMEPEIRWVIWLNI
jgi:hypothetical protein